MFRESGLSNALISKHSLNENEYQPLEHIIETSDMHEYELKFKQHDYGFSIIPGTFPHLKPNHLWRLVALSPPDI